MPPQPGVPTPPDAPAPPPPPPAPAPPAPPPALPVAPPPGPTPPHPRPGATDPPPAAAANRSGRRAPHAHQRGRPPGRPVGQDPRAGTRLDATLGERRGHDQPGDPASRGWRRRREVIGNFHGSRGWAAGGRPRPPRGP